LRCCCSEDKWGYGRYNEREDSTPDQLVLFDLVGFLKGRNREVIWGGTWFVACNIINEIIAN